MPSEKQPVIITKNLSKRFASTVAVDALSLTIPKGQIYTLIGPNGAGKTTLLKLLVGLLHPEKGSVELNGYDIQKNPLEAKRQFSYIPDDPSGYEFLSGREFLVFSGRLLEISEKEIVKRIDGLLPLFPLTHIIDQKISEYSRGTREKIVFLASLLRNPSLLIIDEPLVGLDPKSIRIFGKVLQDFAKNGGTVLLTTHILSFAKEYADVVGILVNGKIIHEGEVKKGDNLDTLYEKYVHEA